jgi:hypothetical protein
MPHLFLFYFLFQISAMVPEYWLTEGSQSATGALLDHIVESHLAGPLVANHATSRSMLPLLQEYFIKFYLCLTYFFSKILPYNKNKEY